MPRLSRIFALLGMSIGCAAAAPAVAPLDPAGVAFFEAKVRPVLVEKCYSCHSAGATKIKGDLLLDSRDATLKGGESGVVLKPGDVDGSLLISAIRYKDKDLKMPPKQALSPDQVADLEKWVRMGAPDPRLAAVAPAGSNKAQWAFAPLMPVEPPSVKDAAWAQTAIDRFIRSAQEAKGISPVPQADRRTLARRLWFDLIGLPPTPAEVDAFVNDPDPRAYDKVVEQLLASPHYGERWARHWLDVARYADSSGYSTDSDRPFAYQYRDFVIRAMNEDLPFNTFVRLQLAGDLIDPKSTDALAATGFVTSGAFNTNSPQEKDRWDELDDVVSTTGSAMLGLTVGCARCHNHKFDPIPSRDYYRLVATFFSSQRADRQLPRSTSADLASLEANRLAATPISDVPEDFPALRRRKGREEAHCLSDRGAEAATGWLLSRGNPEAKVEPLKPGFISILSHQNEDRWLNGKDHPRVALANWMTDTQDGAGALLARVMVNRIWQHHFGHGLVGTPSDFGAQGDLPTNPQLLDWLARQFIESGWSVKSIHRLILASATYQESANWDEAPAKVDPDDHLNWRHEPIRHEAEIVRDSVLAVSGSLNEKMYGPAIFPYIPPEAILAAKYATWPADVKDGPAVWRRSIYIFVKRSVPVPLLQTFDAADTSSSVGKRPITTTVPQALALMDDEFVTRQVKLFARRVAAEASADPRSQVAQAYMIALSRPPTDQEVAVSLNFLGTQAAARRALDPKLAEGDARSLALEDLCQSMMLLNEFVYVN